MKIVNLLFDLSLLMHVSRPLIMEEFYNECKRQYFFAIFLDMGLSILIYTLGVYFYSVLDLRTYDNLDLCNQYFFSFIVFWMGLKSICYLLYWKHEDCLFLDIYEFILVDTFSFLKKFLLLIFLFELILFFTFQYYYLKVMRYYRKRFDRFIEEM